MSTTIARVFRPTPLLALRPIVWACALATALGAQNGKDVKVYRRDEPPPRPNNLFAITIGIDEFAALPTLQFAQRDAMDVAAELQAMGFSVIRMRIDGKDNAAKPHTAKAILEQVRKMCRLASPEGGPAVDSTLLFYYSGHGFENADKRTFLCPADTDPDPAHLATTALDLELVHEEMIKSGAKRRLLVVDMCRNEPGKSAADRTLRLERFQETSGSAFLFSTAPGSKSFEPQPGMTDQDGKPIEHGLFTHFLLRGLRGEAESSPSSQADGFVTFREVAYFVFDGLRGLSMRNKNCEQKPYLKWDGTAEDVLLRVLPEPSAGATPPAEGPLPSKPNGNRPDEDKPQTAPAAAVLTIPQVRIRLYHRARDGTTRTSMERVCTLLEGAGFPPVEKVNLNPGFGLSDQERQARFVGDESVANLDPNQRRFVLYPPGAQDVIAQMKKMLPDPTIEYRERAPTSMQRQREGDAADRVIDFVGLPKGELGAATGLQSADQVPQLAAGQVKIRIYHRANSGRGRDILKTMQTRLGVEGFGSCDIIDLNPKRGMPDAERMQRFVGDQCVFDLNPDRTHLVVYPRGAADVVKKLKSLFPDARFTFQERAETSQQSQKEGKAVDTVIDWIGLPNKVGG